MYILYDHATSPQERTPMPGRRDLMSCVDVSCERETTTKTGAKLKGVLIII